MLAKTAILLLLVAIVVSLFFGRYYLVTDRGRTNRTLKALTWRISIWVLLFALLAVGAYTGIIEPSNSIKPDWARQTEPSEHRLRSVQYRQRW